MRFLPKKKLKALVYCYWLGWSINYWPSARGADSLQLAAPDLFVSCNNDEKILSTPLAPVHYSATSLLKQTHHSCVVITSSMQSEQWSNAFIDFIAGKLQCLKQFFQTRDATCYGENESIAGLWQGNEHFFTYQEILTASQPIYAKSLLFTEIESSQPHLVTGGDDKDPWWLLTFTDIPNHYKEISEDEKQRLTKIGRRKFNLTPHLSQFTSLVRELYTTILLRRARCQVIHWDAPDNTLSSQADRGGRRHHPYRRGRQPTKPGDNDKSYRDRSSTR